MTSNVKVVCRFRPQLPNELAKDGQHIVHVDEGRTSVAVDGQRKAQFTFDRIFNDANTQEDVYDYAARPIVEDVLKGYNGTIFAYGQTSSGKTHTMEGPSIDNPEERGIIPRIVYNVFQYIEMAPETLEFTVRVSYFEIYMEKIYDLLCDGNNNLQIHENRERGVYVRHATELYMQDPEDVMDVMRAGAERRSVAATNMNDVSSRSHSVFLMEITQKDTIKGGVKTGKLFLVDLAGSEKVSKTGAEGEVLSEAKNINKSLSALGLVIMSLVESDKRAHIPYRDSKLTRILQESLGGNSRTTIIICCSPSSYNEQETISTLRFGQRAKNIKNKAKINVKYSADELQKQLDKAKKELKKLAKKLREAEAELEIWRSGGTVSEGDRVQLGQTARASADGDEDEDEEVAAQPAVPGISTEERNELLAREEELLDLLDDKDKFIHELEREIEVLSEDKVTITKLASEKSQLQQMLEEQEEIESQLTAENEEFEKAMQDLAEVNEKLDGDLRAANDRLAKIEASHTEQSTAFASQLATICEGLTMLTSSSTAQTSLPESGTVVDPQLSKVQAFFKQMTTGNASLQKEHGELRAQFTELEATFSDIKKRLATSELSVSQLEQKTSDLTETKERLTTENETLRQQNSDNLARLEKLMTEKLANQEEEEGALAELEDERNKQQEYFRQQNEELTAERDKATKLLEEARSEKDRLAIEVQQLKSDLESQQEHNVTASKALEQLKAKEAEAEQKGRKAEVVEVAAKQQLHSSNVFSAKLRESILAMCRTQISGDGSPAAVGAADGAGSAASKNPTDSRATLLDGEIERLKRENKELLANFRQSKKREAQLTQKYDRALGEIRDLELAMRKTQQEVANFRAHRNSIKNRANPVRGGGQPRGVDRSRERGQFFQDQSAKASRPIVQQGNPMVGQYANDHMQAEKELAEKELNTVQYV